MLTLRAPLTGEPDAGNPPVRFGGRGEAHPSSLPLFFCRPLGYKGPRWVINVRVRLCLALPLASLQS